MMQVSRRLRNPTVNKTCCINSLQSHRKALLQLSKQALGLTLVVNLSNWDKATAKTIHLKDFINKSTPGATDLPQYQKFYLLHPCKNKATPILPSLSKEHTIFLLHSSNGLNQYKHNLICLQYSCVKILGTQNLTMQTTTYQWVLNAPSPVKSKPKPDLGVQRKHVPRGWTQQSWHTLYPSCCMRGKSLHWLQERWQKEEESSERQGTTKALGKDWNNIHKINGNSV